ncbi:WSC domain-containing protein [Nemania sp. FL0031]|nr:WSC domain-containing protein [Nemania sp. FL0031]
MLRQATPSPLGLLSLLLLLLPLLSLLPSTSAQSSSSSSESLSLSPNATATSSAPASTSSKPAVLKIGDSSGTFYSYAGCWNESAGLPGTSGLRSLAGISEALPGAMTVAKCLQFCAYGDKEHGAYLLAGLEYARECWCGDEINAFSVPLPDSACDFGCDGANNTACGGSLKLSVYNATHGVPAKNAAAEWRRRGAWGGTVVGTITLALGFVLVGL